MPNLDLDQPAGPTAAEFDQRKRTLRHLVTYGEGIVSGVHDMLETGGSSRAAQARAARDTFTAEVARAKLNPGSVDHELAWGKFQRQLSAVVGGLRVAKGESGGNDEIE